MIQTFSLFRKLILDLFNRHFLLLSFLALFACNTQNSEESSQPIASSENLLLEESVIESSSDEEEREEEVLPRAIVDRRTAQDRLGDAVFSAKNVMARQILNSLVGETPSEESTSTDFILWVGSNLHSELEQCNCPRNRLGGIARRATMLQGEESGLPQFHIDTGDTLFRAIADLRNEANLRGSNRANTAMIVANSLVTMGIDVMGIGALDLILGGEFITALSNETSAPFLSANLLFNEQPIAPPTRIINKNGISIAFIGVTTTSSFTQEQWSMVGLQATEPLLAAESAIIQARANNDLDLIILISTLGVTNTEPLIEALSNRDAAPDLVLVSGSNRMLRDPLWAAGVPIFEAASRGKYMLRLEVNLAENVPILFRAHDALHEDLMEYIRTLRLTGIAEGNRRRLARRPERSAQAARYDESLTAYYAQNIRNERRIANTIRANPIEQVLSPISTINSELRPVQPSIAENANIRELIDTQNQQFSEEE